MLVLPEILFSEEVKGFKANSAFADYSYGKGFHSEGSFYNALKKNNTDLFPAFANEEQLGFYIYGKSSANVPSLKSNFNKFQFEYGLSNHWGLGVSLRSGKYDVNNYSNTNKITSLLISSNFSTLPEGSELGFLGEYNKNYILAKSNIQILKTATMGVFFSYHFFTARAFDPYISFHLGRGMELLYSGTIHAGSVILGARYFLHPNIYTFAELEGSAIYHSTDKHALFIKTAPSGGLAETIGNIRTRESTQ
jgi:hypothetical protein